MEREHQFNDQIWGEKEVIAIESETNSRETGRRDMYEASVGSKKEDRKVGSKKEEMCRLEEALEKN